MIRSVVHLILHFLIPAAVARRAFTAQWKSAWGIMVLTMIVDLDHLLANPIYDPNRCGIGFHPLHSYAAIGIFLVLAFVNKTRLIGVGLLIHMALDGLDCVWIAFE
jgi:hypothetical protein